MRIKSYFAGSVEDAIDLARAELGPEAMIVNTGAAPQEARHLGRYEVVCALESSGEPAAPVEEQHRIPPEADVTPRLSAELAEMRRQLEGMRLTISRSTMAAARFPASAELAQAFSWLTEAGVDGELADDIVQSIRRPALDSGPVDSLLAREMENRFEVDARLGRGGDGPRAVAVAGPPGSGKTTSLVKLAVSEGLTARRPVQLISMDTCRVAAAEQLRSYAAILGVGFQVLETVGALAQALEEHSRKDLILIDTPGLGFADMDMAFELAGFLAGHPQIDTHLVLTASMKSADLMRVVDAFEVFRPSKLLFTRLDETSSFGPLFSEAVRTGKALSFFGTGQRIPEDFAAAAKGRLIELILRPRAERELSAA